jgi:hypothetical protein
MATLRFEPIAIALGKVLSPARLFPPEVLQRVRQGEPDGERDPAWAPELVEFMAHYTAVVRAAYMLLGAPPFQRLGRLHDEVQKEYQPGGPPMSPVYDSFAAQHILAGVPQGLAGETPYSVLARLSAGDPARARLHELAQALASSHLDLYRVLHGSGRRAELLPVRGGAVFSVHLTGPFLETEDRALVRVLAFGERKFVADSPYLLAAPEAEWLEYFERAGRRASPTERPLKRDERAPAGKPKLTQKQAAKRRKEQKLEAASGTAHDGIARHLRFGTHERYWLEYIMAGYAGERRGIVRLAGVPDRRESLPHDPSHDSQSDAAESDAAESDAAERDPSPMLRVRARVTAIAAREGIFQREGRALAEAASALGAKNTQLDPAHIHLFAAYCSLGARTEAGMTALELYARESSLDAEERAAVEAIQQGFFAVLRVEHVRLDEGFDLLDVVRGETLRVSERSATRQVAIGDLLPGWLCRAPDGVLTLEGGVLHVPALLAAVVTESVIQAYERRGEALPNEPWQERSAGLVLPVLAQMLQLRENPPLPALYNMHDDRLQRATGRYMVLDRARAQAALAQAFEPLARERFGWSDDEGISLAELELSGDSLFVRVNSLERLETVKQRIEAALGSSIRPTLDSLDGDAETLIARARGADAPPPLDLSRLPPEAVRQLHDMVLAQIQQQFDAPLALFKGKSLRQLARGQESRGDAVSWLREQERILKQNPQMTELDLRPLWRELGLEYQGLDTDPR